MLSCFILFLSWRLWLLREKSIFVYALNYFFLFSFFIFSFTFLFYQEETVIPEHQKSAKICDDFQFRILSKRLNSRKTSYSLEALVNIEDEWRKVFISEPRVLEELEPGMTYRCEQCLQKTEAISSDGFRGYLVENEYDFYMYSRVESEWIASSSVFHWRSFSSRLRQFFKNKIQGIYSPGNAPLALALSMGDKSQLSEEVQDLFRISGTYHNLALSGLHGALFFGLLWFFLSLFRLNFAGKLLLILGLFFPFFLLLSDFPPSLFRTWLMLCLFSGLQYFGLKKKPFRVWVISLLLMISLFPEDALRLGFHLSFMAVLGIFVFLNLQDKYLPLKKAPQTLRLVSQYVAVSLGAQLFTLPLIVSTFNQFNALSLFNNIVLTFFIPFAFTLSLLAWLPGAGFIAPYLDASMSLLQHLHLPLLEWVDWPFMHIQYELDQQQVFYAYLILFSLSVFFLYPEKIKSIKCFFKPTENTSNRKKGKACQQNRISSTYSV